MEFGAPLLSYPMDTAVFSPVLKRPEREGEHSPSPSVDISNVRRLMSRFSLQLRGLIAGYSDDVSFISFNYSFT